MMINENIIVFLYKINMIGNRETDAWYARM